MADHETSRTCKYCGQEFENQGQLMAHAKQFREGSCAEAVRESLEHAVQEQEAERDTRSTPTPVYDNTGEVVDGFDFAKQHGVEAQVSSIARKTADLLKEYPREKIMIPKDKLNAKDTTVTVGINGWNFFILKEVPVSLPSPVVELLEQGGYMPTRVR